jgi:hypothetical protein
VSHQSESGFGVRAGRFLPAFGVHFADHTAFNRAYLNFDKYDQVFGVELSQTTDRHLLQVTLSPGKADSIIHDDGRQAFTATGRFQYDITPRTAIVVSGLFRDGSKLEAKSGAGSAALGFAPLAHVSTWTEFDVEARAGTTNTYTLVHETAVEPVRGLWLKFSPQIRTLSQPFNTGQTRMVFEADFLPRTHFNADVSFYRDKDRSSGIVSHVVLLQLHLYL